MFQTDDPSHALFLVLDSRCWESKTWMQEMVPDILFGFDPHMIHWFFNPFEHAYYWLHWQHTQAVETDRRKVYNNWFFSSVWFLESCSSHLQFLLMGSLWYSAQHQSKWTSSILSRICSSNMERQRSIVSYGEAAFNRIIWTGNVQPYHVCENVQNNCVITCLWACITSCWLSRMYQ